MKEIKYVVRYFKGTEYLYSIHCGVSVLDDLLQSAKANGYSVKIVAYDSESEV